MASTEHIGAAEQRQSADVSRSAIGCERPIVTEEGHIALRPPTGVATGWRSSRVPAVAQWLRVRRALTASELDAYAAGYRAVSGYRVEPEYLTGTRPFVALRGGQVVGGFTLNVDPPFRTMMRMPETDRRRLAHEFPADDTVELTCVWLAPEARGAITSATLWGTLVWHARRQQRTNVVFGTDVDRLRRFYERTGPRLLYEGDVRVDGHQRHGWVYSISAHRWPYVLARMIAGQA
jgi:hypothetical protein